MFGDPTRNSLASHGKTGRLEFAAHDVDHLMLCKTGACFYFLKRGPILPGKPDHQRDLIGMDMNLHGISSAEKCPESQVDPGRGDFLGLGHRMNPVMLGLPFHHQQAAIFKENGDDLPGLAVLQLEDPFRPKAHGGDHGIAPEGLLIIAVPPHPLGAVMVEIQQAGVKAMGALLLDTLSDEP